MQEMIYPRYHVDARIKQRSMMSTRSMKALLISIALLARAPSFRRARAFAFVAPPSRQKGQTAATKRNDAIFDANRIDVARGRRRFGVRARSRAENDDERAGDSSPSKRAPKVANKGTQRSERGSESPAAKSKSKGNSKTPVGKTKGTKKKSRKRKGKRLEKRPPEISARSLSSSQTKSNGVQARQKSRLEPPAHEDDQDYAYNIPRTGYSLADQLENNSPENRERFETTLTPIVSGIRAEKEREVEFQYDEDGFPTGFKEIEEEEEGAFERRRHEGVARIDTVSTLGNAGEEPARWLVSFGEEGDGNDGDEGESFAMIDLPPYSDELADEIRSFMDPNRDATESGDGRARGAATLDVILLTNQQCIHYDASPAVYVTRKSDLTKWRKAFPEAEVVMYRLDVPRECRDEVTQVLDGYGPWGWVEGGPAAAEEAEEGKAVGPRGKFVETGRPLTIEEWDEDTKSKVLTRGELPPDDQLAEGGDGVGGEDDGDPRHSPEAIREREDRHRLLAVYTPGHTFGSVTYVFPRRGICCSGYALPLEGPGAVGHEEGGGPGAPPQGPRIDYQGYLATSASRPRQMSSASTLIDGYVDRFRVVLPARGDVVFLDSDEGTRRRELMESVGLYRRIGEIYGRLGIVEK